LKKKKIGHLVCLERSSSDSRNEETAVKILEEELGQEEELPRRRGVGGGVQD